MKLQPFSSCLHGNLWNENDYGVSPTCDVKKKISKLEGLIVNLATALREIRNEFQKCILDCKSHLIF